jgi:hypothetical protein
MRIGICITLISLFCCSFLPAQYRTDCGFRLGVSNYLGDIGGKQNTRRNFVSDMKLAETKMSGGLFIRRRVALNTSLLASYNFGRIAGDDKLSSNPGRHNRNLSFRNDIHELMAGAQYYFFTAQDLGRSYSNYSYFRAYVGLGAGIFYHNPKAFYQGEWYSLRPLKTEGQPKPYSRIVFAIPASIGFNFTFNKRYRIGWDLCWRKTFTDYLDDVSTRYTSPKNLSSPLAAALANRTGELNLSTAEAANYAPGNKRGDPTHKDSYIFSTIDFSYCLRGSDRWYKKASWERRQYLTRRKKLIRGKF